jgi:4-hydroxyproline epimerase
LHNELHARPSLYFDGDTDVWHAAITTIDRSPGGTGTSARMAQLHGKGRLTVGETFRQESLIGTVFEGRIEEGTDVGPFRGIKPSVGGWARIIGHNTIFVDDRDPLAHGFQIR